MTGLQLHNCIPPSPDLVLIFVSLVPKSSSLLLLQLYYVITIIYIDVADVAIYCKTKFSS